MGPTTTLTRRTFLADLGRGSFALLVFGVAGCATGSSSPTSALATTPPPAGASPPPSPSAESTPDASASTNAGGSGGPPASGGLWTRVNLGFVSAYIIVHGREAAIVDTGVAGSVGDIEAAVLGAGLQWADVGHLILTHHHGDHAGSAEDVLGRATGATAYAGSADIPRISVSRPITPVADGASVMGLRIVTTPGHTLGHVAVLDEAAGVLVAGDALGTTGGTLAGSNPAFTADAAAAKASIAKLAALRFETLLVGHGDPILSGASGQVAALAAAG